EKLEHPLPCVPLPLRKLGFGRCGEIAVQEFPYHPLAPTPCECRPVARLIRQPCRHLSDGSPRGVVEGAQHAGHVAQGRALGAALGEAVPRLCLEIDDKKILLRDQNLSKMVITMDTRLPAN